MTAVPQERGDRPVVVRSEGFPPIADPQARVLVLGSLPGQRSIADGRYYAHPQNAFWRIMREMLGVHGDYASRCRQLASQGIALWDVLHSSVRPGSMDAAIRLDTSRVNDFGTFFSRHRQLALIAFNGAKAEQLYRRFVDPLGVTPALRRVRLPSTSPAYASMPFSGKLAAWRDALHDEVRKSGGET